jgi:hypothetical protein
MQEWRSGLPVGLLDWLEHDSHYNLADVTMVAAYSDQTGRSYNVRLVFRGGAAQTIQIEKPYFLPNELIEGYSDIFSPNVWLDRMIMGRRRPLSYNWSADAPNYAREADANLIVTELLSRGDDDQFLQAFARHIVSLQQEQVDDGAVFYLKMANLAGALTPKQICTAAYRAKIEVARRQGTEWYPS